VIGLGLVAYHKGVDRAIRAIGTVPLDRRPELVWVANGGSSEYQQLMEQLAEELHVSLRVKMAIGDDALRDLLCRCSALVYTSRLEPFGFAPLEANACGAPVVAIAEGGVRETIHHGVNGLLVQDDDPVALGKAIDILVSDSDLRCKLGDAGRQLVRDVWTWDRSIEQLEALIYKALEEDPGA
jgi:glycosyltransferase involved in cell wall biosynthesis